MRILSEFEQIVNSNVQELSLFDLDFSADLGIECK